MTCLLEIDYYGGIAPTWKGISFDIGGLYYTYPGAFDPGREFDYFELKTGGSYTFFEALTLGVTNYWSPEFFGQIGDADALELSGEYAFANKWSTSSRRASAAWSAGSGSTQGHRLHLLERRSDPRLPGQLVRRYPLLGYATSAPVHAAVDFCDSRVVGTVSASF